MCGQRSRDHDQLLNNPFWTCRRGGARLVLRQGKAYNSSTFSTHHISEDGMKITMLLLVGAALARAQEDDATAQAIATVRKAEGKVTIRNDWSGKPVVAVDL
jgi:hypothetical protein